MKRHPIIEARDGLVICGGPQPAAALKLDPDKPRPAVGETHTLLRPVFHLGEISKDAAAELLVGDVIEEADDGTKRHVPRPARQQRPER